MDSNRDGVVEAWSGSPDDLDKTTWQYGPPPATGAIITVNAGQDPCDDPTLDCFCDLACVEFHDCCLSEKTPIVISALEYDLPAGWRVVLRVPATDNTIAADSVRIYHEGSVVVPNPHAAGPPDMYEYEIPGAQITSHDVTLAIEAVRYPGWPEPDFDGLVTIVVELRDESDAVVCSDRVAARVAPWMMPSHLDPVTHVYVTNTFPAFPPRLETALAGTGAILIDPPIPSGDPWLQDQWEIGFHSAPVVGDKGYQTVLLNSPRRRDGGVLIDYAVANFDYWGLYGVGETQWYDPAVFTQWRNTHDSFGNLEVLPPLSPPGSSFPLGRIYHGHEQTDGLGWGAPYFGGTHPTTGEKVVNGMKSEVVTFLRAQESQAPTWAIDTSWLRVAHVDEFMTVQATGPDTFRVILASPQMGIDILVQLAIDGFVFEHGQLWNPTESWSAVALLEFVPDPGGAPGVTLRQFNQDLDDHYIEGIRTELVALGIDYVEVPVYFIRGGTGPPASRRAQAALPNMVNLLNVNGTLIVPDPNPNPTITWPAWFNGNDPFKQAFESAAGAGTDVRWIDALEYHYGVGEVHCGTNVRRVPRPEIREWWLYEP